MGSIPITRTSRGSLSSSHLFNLAHDCVDISVRDKLAIGGVSSGATRNAGVVQWLVYQPSKLRMRVQFSSLAPKLSSEYKAILSMPQCTNNFI